MYTGRQRFEAQKIKRGEREAEKIRGYSSAEAEKQRKHASSETSKAARFAALQTRRSEMPNSEYQRELAKIYGDDATGATMPARVQRPYNPADPSTWTHEQRSRATELRNQKKDIQARQMRQAEMPMAQIQLHEGGPVISATSPSEIPAAQAAVREERIRGENAYRRVLQPQTAQEPTSAEKFETGQLGPFPQRGRTLPAGTTEASLSPYAGGQTSDRLQQQWRDKYWQAEGVPSQADINTEAERQKAAVYAQQEAENQQWAQRATTAQPRIDQQAPEGELPIQEPPVITAQSAPLPATTPREEELRREWANTFEVQGPPPPTPPPSVVVSPKIAAQQQQTGAENLIALQERLAQPGLVGKTPEQMTKESRFGVSPEELQTHRELASIDKRIADERMLRAQAAAPAATAGAVAGKSPIEISREREDREMKITAYSTMLANPNIDASTKERAQNELSNLLNPPAVASTGTPTGAPTYSPTQEQTITTTVAGGITEPDYPMALTPIVPIIGQIAQLGSLIFRTPQAVIETTGKTKTSINTALSSATDPSTRIRIAQGIADSPAYREMIRRRELYRDRTYTNAIGLSGSVADQWVKELSDIEAMIQREMIASPIAQPATSATPPTTTTPTIQPRETTRTGGAGGW